MASTMNLKSILAGCAAIATIGAVPVAAGTMSSGGASVIQAQASQQFDDATIEAFATAQARVEEIRASYVAQYQAAETEEERAEIDQMAVDEMVEAVRDTSDITIEEYDAVIQAANEDPDLAERVNEAIAETQL